MCQASCQDEIQSVIQAPNKEVFFTKNDEIWRMKNGQVARPKKISEVFPNGPNSIHAAVTVGNLVVVIEERTLYGYEQDEVTGAFNAAEGYPKSLHNRVLFYPTGAFPLTNGSVILTSGAVFANYNLNDNSPSIIHGLPEYFQNLPSDLVGGFFDNDGEDGVYKIFSKDKVYQYNMQLQQVVSEVPLSSYIGC